MVGFSAFCKRLGAHSFAEVAVLKCGVFLIAWLKGLPPKTEMFSLGNQFEVAHIFFGEIISFGLPLQNAVHAGYPQETAGW